MYVITLPECFRYLKVDATEFFFKQMGATTDSFRTKY